MNSSVSPDLPWHQTTIESTLGVGTQGWTHNVARTAAALTLLIGVGGLIGWAFGIEALKSGWSGFAQIKPNTALSLTLLGVALCSLAFAPAWSFAQVTARSIVWIVVAIASITLVEYILDPAFNIDQVLFVDHSGAVYPGRMGLNTATCLLLLSSAFLLSRSGSARCSVMSQVFAFLAFMIAMTSTFGYLLSVSALTGVASFTLMALHTSVGLIATAIAIWFLQPGLGLMPILTNSQVSGRVVRALLVSVFILTPLLSVLRLRGQQVGWYGTEFGLAIFALSQLCVLTMVIIAVGGLMLRFDIQRLRAELAQRNLMQQLRDSANLAERQVQLRTQELQSSESRLRMVLDNVPVLIGYVDGGLRYIFCNHTYLDWYGREPASCIGKTVQQIVGHEAWQQIAFNYDHALAGSRISYERRLSKGDTHRDILVDLMPDVRPDEGVLGVFIVARDNTARRGAEAALAQREAWLRLVSDNSTACMGYMDTQEVFRFCNRTYQEWYGCDPAANQGMTLRKLIGEAAYAEVGAYYQRGIAGQRTNYERVLKRGDVVRNIAIDLIPDLRENGHIAGVFISGVDITARLVHERALQESNERFRTAFDFAPNGKAIVSLEGQWIKVNSALLEIVGYSEAQMLAMTFQSITHPDDLGADLNQVQRLLDGEIKSFRMEKRYLRVDGEFVYVLLNTSLVRDAKGAPLHFIAQIQDVTERKQAEQAIKDSEERFQLVVQGTDDGIWDWHMETGYCYFSPRYSQLLGYAEDEFPTLRSTFESHLHADEREAVFAALRVHLDKRTPYDVQYRLRLKNGDYRWFHARGQAFWDESGKAVRFAGAMHDVTQTRQAAIELERSQKFLDAVVEAVPQALFVKDHQHRWVLFNQAFSDLAGQDRAALVGKSDPDIMPAELARRSWDEDDRAFAQDGAVISEIEMIRHDGSKRWLLKSKRRVDLPDGAYIVGVATDVTGMKTIQSALTHSEELHRLLADNSSDMITRLTPEAIIEYASPASALVLGYAPDELKGTSVAGFMHPDDAVAARARFVEVVKQNEAKTVTCRLRRKRGGWVWVETSFRAVREPGSSWTLQVIGVSRDVDERVRVTEALNRFKHVLDNTLDMILMYDVEHFRFNYVNLGAANSLGYTREQLIGLSPWDIRGDITEADYRIWVQPLLKGEMKSSQLEAVFRRADGSEFPVDATIQLVSRPGETPVLISVVRDATERKKIDRMKSEFISTVSHELRTPLTSIRGSLGLIVGGALGPVADQTLNLIRIAHSNSERLVRLINDILDIEKVESGSMRFDMQPHRLAPLLEHALEANRAYGEQLGVRLKLTEPLPDVRINVDADRFQQIMSNLLSNACKFSVSGDQVEVTAAVRMDRVCISVTDHGPGIPLEFRTKIFGKFSQADSSDTRQKSGTGLGLSIVKTMTEKHNGIVSFDTQIGFGTTFHIMLPIVDPETLAATVESVALPPSPTRASHDKHVLICEDDSAIAASIERTLQSAGFTADIAYNLAQARAHLAKTHYGAMTLDLKLPDGDGKQLLAELRAVPATKHLPVIVLSGYADDRTIGLDGSEAPPLSWLSKPVDSQRLLNLLHKTVAQSGARPRILHVEDDRDVKQVIAAIVGELADFDHASTLEQARRKISDGAYSLVLLDLELPDGSGWDLLADLDRLVPPPPVVLFSASELTANESKRVAASLMKSHTTNEALLSVIGRLLRRPPAARDPRSMIDKHDLAS